VSISDFIDLASRFNQQATKWSDGDLNYDGQVTISDFIDLAANFNHSLPPPAPAAAAGESVSIDSAGGENLNSDADTAVIAKNESGSLFSRSSSKRHTHHKRHAHKESPHWISRAGAY